MSKYNKFISASLLIALEIIIFCFSQNNGTDSSEMSNFITNLLFGNIIDSLNFDIGLYIRKAAHVAEYMVLSFAAYYFTASFFKNRNFLIPVAIVIATACIDEFHQTFISGRSGQFSDVLVDCIGLVIASLIMILFRQKFKFFSSL